MMGQELSEFTRDTKLRSCDCEENTAQIHVGKLGLNQHFLTEACQDED